MKLLLIVFIAISFGCQGQIRPPATKTGVTDADSKTYKFGPRISKKMYAPFTSGGGYFGDVIAPAVTRLHGVTGVGLHYDTIRVSKSKNAKWSDIDVFVEDLLVEPPEEAIEGQPCKEVTSWSGGMGAAYMTTPDGTFTHPLDQLIDCKNGKWVRDREGEVVIQKRREEKNTRLSKFERGDEMTVDEIRAISEWDMLPEHGGVTTGLEQRLQVGMLRQLVVQIILLRKDLARSRETIKE